MDLGACQLQIDDKVTDRGGSWLANIIDVNSLESIVLPPTFQVIGENQFTDCENQKSVTFGDCSQLQEIGRKAFYEYGLESFEAPPGLENIGDMAVGKCGSLANFKLNDDIQELGQLCFQGTQITGLEIPPQVEKT